MITHSEHVLQMRRFSTPCPKQCRLSRTITPSGAPRQVLVLLSNLLCIDVPSAQMEANIIVLLQDENVKDRSLLRQQDIVSSSSQSKHIDERASAGDDAQQRIASPPPPPVLHAPPYNLGLASSIRQLVFQANAGESGWNPVLKK